jgi:hypothetical protein
MIPHASCFSSIPLGCAFPTITNSHVRGLTHVLSALRTVRCSRLYSAVTVLVTLLDATLWIWQPLQAPTIATATCWALCHTGVAVGTAVQDYGRATDAPCVLLLACCFLCKEPSCRAPQLHDHVFMLYAYAYQLTRPMLNRLRTV